MSKYIRNWEDWDEIEDETSLEQTRNKRKNKLHKESKVNNVKGKKFENNQINKIKFTNIPMNRKEIEFFQSKIRAIRKNKNWKYAPQ